MEIKTIKYQGLSAVKEYEGKNISVSLGSCWNSVQERIPIAIFNLFDLSLDIYAQDNGEVKEIFKINGFNPVPINGFNPVSLGGSSLDSKLVSLAIGKLREYILNKPQQFHIILKEIISNARSKGYDDGKREVQNSIKEALDL